MMFPTEHTADINTSNQSSPQLACRPLYSELNTQASDTQLGKSKH